jgi:hypothetical protein
MNIFIMTLAESVAGGRNLGLRQAEPEPALAEMMIAHGSPPHAAAPKYGRRREDFNPRSSA